MAATSKVLARAAFATSSGTLYTVPNSSTTTVVTSIVVCNTAATSATFIECRPYGIMSVKVGL